MSLRQEMLKRRLKNSSVWYNRPAKATGEQIKRTYSKEPSKLFCSIKQSSQESSQRLMNLMKEVADINRKDANLLSDESEVAR